MAEDNTPYGGLDLAAKRFSFGLLSAMNAQVMCIDPQGDGVETITPHGCVHAAKKAGFEIIHLDHTDIRFPGGQAGDIVIVRPVNRLVKIIGQRQDKPWWRWYIIIQGPKDGDDCSGGIVVHDGIPSFEGKIMYQTPWFYPKKWGIVIPGASPLTDFLIFALHYDMPKKTKLPEATAYIKALDFRGFESEVRTVAVHAISSIADDAGLQVIITDKTSSK